MATNTQEQRPAYRTSMELDRCLNRKDEVYLKITMQGRFFKPETALSQISPETSVIHCKMMISGQEQYISRYMGGWVPEVNEKGAIWVQVSFFNKTAERFLKFAAAHPDAFIVVTGALITDKYTSKKDNLEHWGLSINAYGFYAPNVSSSAPTYGGSPAAPGGYGAPQAPAAPAAPTAPGGYGAPQAPAAPAAPGGYGAPKAPAAPAAPAAPGGYGAPQAPTAPAAPAGGVPIPDQNGFYDIGDDDGQLPF